MNVLNEPFYIKEYQLYVTASIGISTYPENGVSSLELLRNANLALYKCSKKVEKTIIKFSLIQVVFSPIKPIALDEI